MDANETDLKDRISVVMGEIAANKAERKRLEGELQTVKARGAELDKRIQGLLMKMVEEQVGTEYAPRIVMYHR